MKRRPIPYWPSFHGPKPHIHRQHLEDSISSIDPYEQALRYISHYPVSRREKIKTMITEQSLGAYLLKRYPTPHHINTNKSLRQYTKQIKSQYLKSSERLHTICFDDKLHLIHHALGTQSFITFAHGGRLKARRELRISSLFKHCPEPLLKMIVVHELAHLKEKEHNDAFYRLCVHMENRYHQLEFEARLYLIHKEIFGSLYPTIPTNIED